ncbi:MAG: cytochrome C peroxidase [Cytophagaceae bacterium]|nr:cytochrome C peroxidase [Gemmatimonadaceae bacterium]
MPVCLGALSLLLLASCRTAEPSPASAPAQQLFVAGLDTLGTSLERLEVALAGQVDTADAIRVFREARRAFKRVEGLLTYYIPISTAEINGPRLEPDDDDPAPPVKSAPIGFQVIEGALFDGSVPMDSARVEMRRMRRIFLLLRGVASTNPILPNAAPDAARLQLARVTTLGLAGIDADPSGDAIVEAAYALEGVRDLLLTVLADPARRASVESHFGQAITELRAHPNFADFDRLHFIVGPATQAGRLLSELQSTLGAPEPGVRRFWRESAGTPFEAGAFSTQAFPPAHARTPSPALEAIGQRLFFDPSLSGPRTRSCASCHQPARAFTDGRARAEPMPGPQRTPLRNTPTLLNVGMQPAFFADDRALSLENQVGVVLASPAEMGSSADTAATRVQADSSYRAAFAAAMPDRGDSAITGLEIRQALAAHLRTLNAMDSRFDRAVRGDTLAMTDGERRGLTVFLGRAKCGTCHFMPLFNGVTPPFYRTSEAEIIGVPATANLDRTTLDPDVGRSNVEDNLINRFAFKVTSLRNVALTAPYMHNGVFRTLEEVIEFYDRGGGVGIGLTLPYQTLPSAPLKLTADEKKDLIAFLGALTDTIPKR